MRFLFLFLMIYSSFVIAKANITGDTLVLPEEIIYSDNFEEEVMNEFLKGGTPDYFKLFLASSGKYSENEYKKSVKIYHEFLNELKTSKVVSAKPKKKIRIIYPSVHERFFKKYELQTSFDDIFNEGIYNCVTATALYGMILNDLDIPFVIVEAPTHIYLVAYPEGEEIKIETTQPAAGYYTFDQKSKKSFVDYWMKSKIVSENEYNTYTIDEIFNKYYYSDNRIHLKELLAIQYYNLAVYKLSDYRYQEGYDYLEKSYLLYPAERTRVIMFLTLADILKSQNYETIDDLRYFLKLTRFGMFGVTVSDIKSEFARITDYYLVNRSNLAYYNEIYEYLMSNINNREFKVEIGYIYHYEKGRYLMNKSQYTESHACFSKAYELKPRNSDAQNAFVQSIALLLNQLTVSEALSKIEDYYSEKPDLKNNKTFISLLLHAYLVNAYQDFNMQQLSKGLRSLERFEEIYKTNREIDIMQNAIADAYSAAGVYYFRKGNYKKAKEYIDRGLSYAPGNFKLIMSRNSF